MSKRNSRGRIAGRKVDQDEFKERMYGSILALIKQGITSPAEMGKRLMKDRSTIVRYLQQMETLPDNSPYKIKRSESGRLQNSPQVEAAKEYADLSKSDFVQSYPSVRRWLEDMSVRKDGKPLAQMSDHVTRLKVICDTLKVSPETIILESVLADGKRLSPRETIEETYKQFAIEFAKTHTTAPQVYKMSIRNYAMACGINWPRGVSGLMSGKKVGYGKYAHIKLTDDQIKQGVRLAKDPLTARWFRLGIESCARSSALAMIPIDSIEAHPKTDKNEAFLTVRATETKTQTTWTKFFVDPTAQQMALAQIEDQKASNHPTLFLDGVSLKEFQSEINKRLKALYSAMGLTDPYFFAHPTHALRHCGAQYWLRITNWDYDLVGVIGGWKSSVLKEAYGARPAESILEAVNEATRRVRA